MQHAGQVGQVLACNPDEAAELMMKRAVTVAECICQLQLLHTQCKLLEQSGPAQEVPTMPMMLSARK